MRSITWALTIAAAFVVAAGPSAAQAPSSVAAAVIVDAPLAVPALQAPSYILLDYHSGRVLAAKNAEQRIEPASLTKMMTAYIVFSKLVSGELQPAEPVKISKRAWRAEGSRTFVEVGSKVPVEVLLKGMVIQSGNDASIALAEHIAGSEAAFADLMNSQAAELGMTASHFVNVTGLPHPQHYTTARDLATLAMAALRHFPEYHELYATKEFTWNNIRQPNRNKLLWSDPTVDGIKTGYTASAKYCIATTAERDGMRLVSIVLGADSPRSRTRQAAALLDYGFNAYETRRLATAAQALTSLKVWKGREQSIAVGAAQDVWMTLARSQHERVRTEATLPAALTAPVAAGAEVGQLVVSLEGEILRRIPLVTLTPAEEGDVWRQLVDEVRLRLD